jgi:hypothetical protein
MINLAEMRIKVLPAAALLIALSLLSQSVAAFQSQLDARAIHEAYVLGQRNDKATGDFLAGYLSEISEPQQGPHIAQIELLTPFAEVVDRSRQKSAGGYSEEQASQDYKSHGDSIKVNIVIMLPDAFPKPADGGASAPPGGAEKSDLRPENFWQKFQFNLKQQGKAVPSRGISNQPVHSTATSNAPAVLDGENVWLEFDVKDVKSEETTVEVVTPETKIIKATFDLRKLK